MPADFLQSLLQGELESSPNNPATADRAAHLDAITQYLRAGNTEPVAVENPSYGPISDLLRKLGVQSRYRPVTPQMSNEMWLGGQVEGQEKQAQRLKNLGAIQDFSTGMGTEPGRQLAHTLGEDEIGEELPRGVKGVGELRMSAQDIQLQRALMSNDIQQQRLAQQELAMQTRQAIADGNMQRAQQLIQLSQERVGLEEEHMTEAPLNQMGHSLLSSIDSQEGQLIKQRADLIASGQDESSAAVQYLDKERNVLIKRRQKLLKIQGTAKTPADYGALYDDEEEPAPKGKVKPPAKSLNFD